MSGIDLVDKPDYVFITEDRVARDALEHLPREMIVGLDTETYWDASANISHVSLVQIAPPGKEVLVFDVLSVDVEILRPLTDSPTVTMAAHNARFDEAMLMRAGLRPVSFVDTLRLAREALRLPSYSLAGVVAHLFGIELDKSFQKSNWRRRPLSRAQLQYAATDAHLALFVYEELRRILAEQGRFDDALKIAALNPSTRDQSAAPRKRRAPLPPLRPLDEEEKKTLRCLKKWRLEKSFAERKPAYMICQDRTLEQMAIERPATLEALESIYGLGASRIARYGEELLKALTGLQDEDKTDRK
ncbi:MAG TPA: HRDC domain-containing protein [Pyrinomonadaceae bacterium]|nr:HRDC domain-containing protein [Pyrinomonadaceae bacterium]